MARATYEYCIQVQRVEHVRKEHSVITTPKKDQREFHPEYCLVAHLGTTTAGRRF